MYQPHWITIAGGVFTMGSDPRDAAPPFANEQPLQRLELPRFSIGRYPITNAQYRRFVEATGHAAPSHWPGGAPRPGTEANPVTYVSWHDAQAFCRWAGLRLPSEAEWEKAARGPATSGAPSAAAIRWWPWGNDLPGPEHGHFNGQAQGVAPAAQGVVPVGCFPRGASVHGVHDLAGNVWEWTSSRYAPYPYDAEDGREDPAGPGSRVLRGGSYNHDMRQVRCAARDAMAAGVQDVYIGFRVACTGPAAAGSGLDIDWVDIPAGPFWLGSPKAGRRSAVLPSEMPQHQVALAAFRIAQTPVTNAEYRQFVSATEHPSPLHWQGDEIPAGLEHHPVTHVDWYDAQAFCRWAGVRLPSEAEWERAAAGAHSRGARIYPWGNQPPGTKRSNFGSDGKQSTTTAVDRHPGGATPEGLLDMAGNVWEWASSLYAPYPYNAGDGREALETRGQRVLRGGSFLSPSAAYIRCSMRSLSYETRRREHIGFRVAQDIAGPSQPEPSVQAPAKKTPRAPS